MYIHCIHCLWWKDYVMVVLPNSVFSDFRLELEISHGGNVYSPGIGKYCTTNQGWVFFWEPIIKHWPIYHYSALASQPLRFKNNRMVTAPSNVVRSTLIGYFGHISIPEPNTKARGKFMPCSPPWTSVRGCPMPMYVGWSPHENQGLSLEEGTLATRKTSKYNHHSL